MTPNLDQERVERAAEAMREHIVADNPMAAARAAITAYLGDTHVVVPREPTEAMLEAGEDTFVSGYTGTPTSSPEDVWKAMLSATPTVNGKGE